MRVASFTMRRLVSLVLVAAFPVAAVGHPLGALVAPDHFKWTFSPWVVGLLLASAVAYGTGIVALWRHAAPGRGVRIRQAAAFAAGWLALVAALVSPLDGLSARLFSAHMVQHEIMMILAAPLLVIGRPLAVFAWAFPKPVRGPVVESVRLPPVMATWNALTWAPTAWALHGAALWAWHLPALFDAALMSSVLHTLQHASFFITALLFWWEPLAGAQRPGPALLYLFTTMLHTAALGALLTLSPSLWYGSYGQTAPALGIDPLEDQQLGGLVMWVPGGLAYFVVALLVVWRIVTGRASTIASRRLCNHQKQDGEKREPGRKPQDEASPVRPR